jgi:hypothetical protein
MRIASKSRASHRRLAGHGTADDDADATRGRRASASATRTLLSNEYTMNRGTNINATYGTEVSARDAEGATDHSVPSS